jgi:hypothetical protein
LEDQLREGKWFTLIEPVGFENGTGFGNGLLRKSQEKTVKIGGIRALTGQISPY